MVQSLWEVWVGRFSIVSELKKLKRSVMVDVAYTQSLNGLEPFEIDEEVFGSLYRVDKENYILAYDSEVGGRKITSTVKIANNILSIVKIGDVHSRQTFALNQCYNSQYFYGGGSIMCRNYTKKLDFALTPEGGLIQVLYELWSGESHLGFFHQEFFIH
jgi:uncharacterized beta-barrel protein YwiB (DUF1934 family)